MPTEKLRSFTVATPRPLPVIVLADTSGSMGVDGKIEALNTALADMISAFAEVEDSRAEIHLSIITFGEETGVHTSLTPAGSVKFSPLNASGRTPMGEAFNLTREMVEDTAKVPSRAYTPALVLVSDGCPTDDWKSQLEGLFKSPRASKAQRFALGIGEGADVEVLRAFLNDPEQRVLGAADARQIETFFRWVTMSVTTRSRSSEPNQSPTDLLPPSDLDDLL